MDEDRKQQLDALHEAVAKLLEVAEKDHPQDPHVKNELRRLQQKLRNAKPK